MAVQRLIGGLSKIGAERDIASRLHVVLPARPTAACSAVTAPTAKPSRRSTR
ncbi:fatty-acid synthase domain protein [Mycobacterium xenopi 3993]|nr:fatty-acid synthase domain protein [Mycobacterium xenopi 3993]